MRPDAFYHTGRNISLRVRRVTRKMVDWLEENPQASEAEMCAKSRELNRIRFPSEIETGETDCDAECE